MYCYYLFINYLVIHLFVERKRTFNRKYKFFKLIIYLKVIGTIFNLI